MLDFKRDRLDYGEMLIPPEGFVLERALATTYSLDLNTLLSIPVALFFSQTLEGDLTGERLELLEAIQRCPQLLRVYHQKGKIKVPAKHNRLFAFMEDCLVDRLPPGVYSSFHPKVWVLRYTSSGESNECRYRVLVLSRNLTYDRSWDIAVRLDGGLLEKEAPRNRPLVRFCKELLQTNPFDDADTFLQDLARADFRAPPGFKPRTFSFHPSGIAQGNNPIKETKAHRVLCLSPFVDKHALKTLRESTTGRRFLFSRSNELDRLSAEDLRDFEVYCLSELVVNGERCESADDGGLAPATQDLHAKLFVYENEGDTARWFVGSANCTRAALDRNVEFLVELKVWSGGLRFDRLLHDELLGTEGVFELYERREADAADTDDEALKQKLRKLEFKLLDGLFEKATVSKSSTGTNYDVSLVVNPVDLPWDDFECRVSPFNCDVGDQRVDRAQRATLVFENINETALSQFFHVQIFLNDKPQRAFLCLVPMDLPPTRKGKILRALIADREAFFSYLQFLLGDRYQELGGAGHASQTSKQHGDKGGLWDLSTPFFEQLLLAASRNPSKLRQVDALIRRLQTGDVAGLDAETDEAREIVPPEFLTFWEPFRATVLAPSQAPSPPADGGKGRRQNKGRRRGR